MQANIIYSEFQLRSNLRVAFASVRNCVWMYAYIQSIRDSVRKRMQHGLDSNATEIRCTSVHPHAIPYGSERNTEIRTQLKFAVYAS